MPFRSFNQLARADLVTPLTITDPNPSLTALWVPDDPTYGPTGLDPGKDYILMGAGRRSRGIQVIGGRNIGAYNIDIVLQVDQTMMLFTSVASSIHCENCFYDPNGHEGDLYKTSGSSNNTIIQIKGTLCKTKLIGSTVSGHVHADFNQTSAGFKECWYEDCTYHTAFDGMMHQREANVENMTSADFFPVTMLTKSGNIATARCPNHNFVVGEAVGIWGAATSGWNGGWTVLSVAGSGTTKTITFQLGDTLPANLGTGAGTVAQIVRFDWAYTDGKIRINRVNAYGESSGTGLAPSSALQMIRFGARAAPVPNSGTNPVGIAGYTRQNEDRTPLTLDWFNGDLLAQEWYGQPPGTQDIGLFVEPDSNVNNYSGFRPVLHSPTGAARYIDWPNNPKVLSASRLTEGVPPGGDFVTGTAQGNLVLTSPGASYEVPGSGGGSTFDAPPPYVAPDTTGWTHVALGAASAPFNFTTDSQTFNCVANTNYVFDAPNRMHMGAITINMAPNSKILVRGLYKSIGLTSAGLDPSPGTSTTGQDSGALNLKIGEIAGGAAGAVAYIEGLHVDGDAGPTSPLWGYPVEQDGLRLSCPNTIVWAKNCRIVDLIGGLDPPHRHADVIQTDGGYKELHLEDFKGTSHYNGIYARRENSPLTNGLQGKLFLNGVDIGGFSTNPASTPTGTNTTPGGLSTTLRALSIGTQPDEQSCTTVFGGDTTQDCNGAGNNNSATNAILDKGVWLKAFYATPPSGKAFTDFVHPTGSGYAPARPVADTTVTPNTELWPYFATGSFPPPDATTPATATTYGSGNAKVYGVITKGPAPSDPAPAAQVGLNYTSAFDVLAVKNVSGGPSYPTHDFDRAGAGTVSSRLQAIIDAAAADITVTPATITKILPLGPQSVGPNSNQGVARIPFDTASGIKTGTNRIIVDAQVVMKSNVRLEIDSGVELVHNNATDDGLFNTNNASNWSMTVGDRSRNGGYWSIDTSAQPTNLKSRLTHLLNSSNFLIEWLESKQTAYTSASATAVIPAHTAAGLTPGPTNSPRNFMYRHHKNTGSGPGWGTNQFGSAYNAWIEDIQTSGGTAVRLETDGNAAGIHNVHVKDTYTENGNYSCTLTPHAASSSDIYIEGVRGYVNHGGMFVGTYAAGQVTNTVITGGCIVGASTGAQDPATPAATTFASLNAVFQNSVASGGVTISGIGRAGSFTAGSPGGDTTVSCSTPIAQIQNTDTSYQTVTLIGGTPPPPPPPPPPPTGMYWDIDFISNVSPYGFDIAPNAADPVAGTIIEVINAAPLAGTGKQVGIGIRTTGFAAGSYNSEKTAGVTKPGIFGVLFNWYQWQPTAWNAYDNTVLAGLDTIVDLCATETAAGRPLKLVLRMVNPPIGGTDTAGAAIPSWMTSSAAASSNGRPVRYWDMVTNDGGARSTHVPIHWDTAYAFDGNFLYHYTNAIQTLNAYLNGATAAGNRRANYVLHVPVGAGLSDAGTEMPIGMGSGSASFATPVTIDGVTYGNDTNGFPSIADVSTVNRNSAKKLMPPSVQADTQTAQDTWLANWWHNLGTPVGGLATGDGAWMQAIAAHLAQANFDSSVAYGGIFSDGYARASDILSLHAQDLKTKLWTGQTNLRVRPPNNDFSQPIGTWTYRNWSVPASDLMLQALALVSPARPLIWFQTAFSTGVGNQRGCPPSDFQQSVLDAINTYKAQEIETYLAQFTDATYGASNAAFANAQMANLQTNADAVASGGASRGEFHVKEVAAVANGPIGRVNLPTNVTDAWFRFVVDKLTTPRATVTIHLSKSSGTSGDLAIRVDATKHLLARWSGTTVDWTDTNVLQVGDVVDIRHVLSGATSGYEVWVNGTKRKGNLTLTAAAGATITYGQLGLANASDVEGWFYRYGGASSRMGTPQPLTVATNTDSPALAIVAPTANQVFTTSGTKTVTATASDNDNISTMEVRVDGGAWQTMTLSGSQYTANVSLSGTAGQSVSHVIDVRATDAYPDTTKRLSTTKSITVFVNVAGVDTTPPTLSVTTPATNGSVANATDTQTVAGSASDNVGVTSLTVNGTAVVLTGGSFSTTVPLVVGANTITVIAKDAAGNTTTVTRTVTRDAPVVVSPPTVAISSPSQGQTYAKGTRTITLSGTASDPVALQSVTYSIDGSAETPLAITGGAFSQSIGVTVGTHTITVTATNSNGLRDTDARSVVIPFDDAGETGGGSTNVNKGRVIVRG